jgi:hypothetical protein
LKARWDRLGFGEVGAEARTCRVFTGFAHEADADSKALGRSSMHIVRPNELIDKLHQETDLDRLLEGLRSAAGDIRRHCSTPSHLTSAEMGVS